MDENQSEATNSGNNKNILVMAIVGIIVIALVLGGGYYFLNMNKSQDSEMVESQTPSPAGAESMIEEEGVNEQGVTGEPQSSNYKDGTYSAVGTYSYHSGKESIKVTVTIESGVITESTVVAQAVHPTSVKIQDDFIANYESQVVGKNIDEVKLGKISGSSLTPIGFNAAVEDIRAQAQS